MTIKVVYIRIRASSC